VGSYSEPDLSIYVMKMPADKDMELWISGELGLHRSAVMHGRFRRIYPLHVQIKTCRQAPAAGIGHCLASLDSFYFRLQASRSQ
jgi:hypothetical protein